MAKAPVTSISHHDERGSIEVSSDIEVDDEWRWASTSILSSEPIDSFPSNGICQRGSMLVSCHQMGAYYGEVVQSAVVVSFP
jgi:hypothetical protein